MFNFLKKTNNIHESLEQQKMDIIKLNPLIATEILKGLSCDKLPNATGEFGSITNPIPVNGPLGEIKYLGKLRGKTGHAVFFHRIGSTISNVTNNPIDIFELVCQDGTQWNNLHFDYYHPRRSNLTPHGYTLIPFNKQLNMDLPFAYGVTSFVSNFPYDLPKALDNFYGSSGTYSRHAQKWLDDYLFQNPDQNPDQNPIQNTKKQSFSKTKITNSTDDIHHFSLIAVILKEVFNRIMMVVLTLFAIKIDWKLALIAPPIAFKIFDSILSSHSRIDNNIIKLILDVLTWISYVGYLIFAILFANSNIDAWYSWLVGIGMWLLFGQILGFLFPRRWHFENIEKRL